MRRAVRFGNGWHPIQFRVPAMRAHLLPRLHAIAEREDLPVPQVCPRIKLLLTEAPLPEAQRLAGQGTLEQVHSDLAALQDLGAAYVLLDPYDGQTPARHAVGWRMLSILAEEVLDLEHETLR